MKNLALNSLVLVFLFSCVGKMAPLPNLQIRGNYKLEFIAKSMGKDWGISTSNKENKGVVFLGLNDIYSNVDLIIKISKPSANLISSDNEIEVSFDNEDKSLFLVDSSDCNGRLMMVGSSCTILVRAFYKEGGAQIGLIDGLDILLEEKVNSQLEEPLKVKFSIDMHRKVKSSISLPRVESIDLGAVNYYVNKNSINDLFNIEGEFAYTINASLDNYSDEFERKIIDKNGQISSELIFKHIEEGSSGEKDTNLNIDIAFENGESKKLIFPIIAKRLSKPNLVLNAKEGNKVWKNKKENKGVELENTGETPIDIETLTFIKNVKAFYISQFEQCISKLGSGSKKCSFKIEYDPADLALSYLEVIKIQGKSDGVTVNKDFELVGNISDPAVLEAKLEGNKISEYNFGANILNSNKTVILNLTNDRAVSAVINSSGVSITDNTDKIFSVAVSGDCDLIGVNSNCNLTVNLNANKVGSYESTIRLPYTDATLKNGILEIKLNTVIKDVAKLSFVNPPSGFGIVLKGASESCSLGTCDDTNKYYKEKIQTVSIKNTGDWDAGISSIKVETTGGLYNNLFSILDNTCSSLASNATCSFKIKFSSENFNDITNGIQIADYGTKVKIVYNNGVVSDKFVESNAMAGRVFLPGTLVATFSSSDFGTKVVGEIQEQTLTLKNASSSTNKIHFADIKILDDAVNKFIFDANDSYWSVTENTCSNLSNLRLKINGTCTIIIRFKPVNYSSFNFPVDSMNFPYTGLTVDDVVVPLNTNFKFNYTKFIDADADSIPDLASSSSELKAKVGKNAELVILAVSTAARKSTDPANDNYNWFTNTTTALSSEGTLATVVGTGEGFWNFDKTFVNDTISSSNMNIKLLNIGYKLAFSISAVISGADSSSFTGYFNDIEGASAKVAYLQLYPTSAGEKTATFTAVKYMTGGALQAKNIGYSKANPSATASIVLKGFVIAPPTLSVGVKNSDDSYSVVSVTYDLGNFIFGLGQYNTRLNKTFRAVITKSTDIPAFYAANIKVGTTNYTNIPAELQAFSFNNQKIVRKVFDENLAEIPSKAFSQQTYIEGAKVYSVEFGLDDAELTNLLTYDTNKKLCMDDSFILNRGNSSLHILHYRNHNIYGSTGPYHTRLTTFLHKNKPSLSVLGSTNSSYCYNYFNTANNSDYKVLMLRNNTNFSISDLSFETLGSCTTGSTTINDTMFEVLYNGQISSDGNYTCSTSNSCVLGGSIAPNTTCYVCLYYRKDNADVDGYKTLTQDIDASYKVSIEEGVTFEKDTNFYFQNILPSNGFGGAPKVYTISANGTSYSGYTSDGICNNSLISNSSTFYIKRIMKNSDEKTLNLMGVNRGLIYFIPQTPVSYTYLNSPSYSYSGLPYDIKINSFTCGGQNALLSSTNILIPQNGTCEIVYKAKTKTTHNVYDENGNVTGQADDLFSNLCSVTPNLTFSSYFYYYYRDNIKSIRYAECQNGLSGTKGAGFWDIGSGPSNGF